MKAEGPWMTPGARVSIVVLFLLMCGVAIGNLMFTKNQVDTLRTQQLAACSFAFDLGTVPIPDKPHPSKFGISLVVDSRAQWRALHCPGTLPVPPGLARWAKVYGLPAN